jgi:carboxymethylenebutenolidase
MDGAQIKITLPEGSADAYVAKPKGIGPWPGVLFFMDALGFRPAMFEMADRLASHGYVVLLPNVFWRSDQPEIFDAKGFTDPAVRDKIMGLIGKTAPVAMKDAASWLDTLAALPEVKDKQRIGTTGYCMGGGFSIHAAATHPDRIGAAASFHGGGFLTSPECPGALAKSARAHIYIGVAETDQRHTPEVTKALEAALTEAKVPHQVETYPGVAHGFAVTDHPVYNKDAAEKHWERLVGLLRAAYA